MQRNHSELRRQYPDVISAEQLSKICHISKRKAKWLLENRVIPCEDTGKKTWRFLIRIDDVIDYLIKRDSNSLEVVALSGAFSSKSPEAYRAPVDLDSLLTYTQRLWHNEPDMLTVDSASRLSGRSPDTIYNWIKKGRLMSIYYMGRLFQKMIW